MLMRRTFLAVGLAAFGLAAFLARPGAAQTASLLRDINVEAGPLATHVNFYGMAPAGDLLYFVVQLEANDREVWVSDGTAEGTEMLRDSCPGPCSLRPSLWGAIGRTMLWFESDFLGGGKLWRSDGTRPGTYPLLTEPADSSVTSLRERFDGALYFTVCSRETVADCALWRTEGTQATTRLVDAAPRLILWIEAAGDRLFYLTSDGTAWELWTLTRSQPVPLRLRRFAAPPSRPPRAQVGAGGRLFFLAQEQEGEELWTSDGTVAGTKALTRMRPDEPFLYWLKAVGDRVYFFGADDKSGRELWRSDGTAAGTLRLTNFTAPEPFDNLQPDALGATGDRVFFSARSESGGGGRIWSSRGTPATTAPVDPACADCVPGAPSALFEAGGKVYFFLNGRFANLYVVDGPAAEPRIAFSSCASVRCDFGSFSPWKDGALVLIQSRGERRFWFTNGTAAGTRPWIEFAGESGGISPQPAEIRGQTFFLASDERSTQLWEREPDGATRPAALLGSTAASSIPHSLLAVGDELFFLAREGNFETEDLWRSAGSPESTFPLRLASLRFGSATSFVRSGGLAYFQSFDFGTVNLWRTDGTEAGTVLLGQVDSRTLSAAYQDGLIFFQGTEIWRSDGTQAGTVKVGALPAEVESIREVFAGPQGIYLSVGTASRGSEVWFTDGTLAGTRPLARFGPVSLSWQNRRIVTAGGRVYFVAPDGIWRTDGSEAGTSKILSREAEVVLEGLSPAPGGIYFFQRSVLRSVYVRRLWKTDGTAAGTVELASFQPRLLYPEAPEILSIDGRAYFSIDDGAHGEELWTSDGSPAGTVLARDIFPGSLGSQPHSLVDGGGVLYFSAADALHGFELWRSDGTTAGTRMVQDIAPQAPSSSPGNLTVAGDRLYFVADDGLSGLEPWVLPLAAGGCVASTTRLCLGGGRYAVDATWRDHQGNQGVGQGTGLTADTGYFWFFDPANVETVLKVLDGRAVNGHVWVFYGALSDVEYSLTVTDTETGLSHRYRNPPGRLASVADTRSFGPLGASPANGPSVTTEAMTGAPLPLVDRRVMARAATGACAPSSARLCLGGGRFAVEVAWKDFSGNTGTGQGVGLTGDTGYFWFFDAANVELVLKVLDGSAVNGHAWVFYGALSSVEYTVTVTDTQTGVIKTYRNPSGNLASVADVEAF